MHSKKIVVAVTGASGALYAERLLLKLHQMVTVPVTVALVFSDNAQQVWEHELQNKDYEKYAEITYNNKNFYAPFASGSSAYTDMVIVPCSMGTLARIAHGVSSDLITRAADVMLKERRKLILVQRDTPLNLIHIQNMQLITQAGGIICPANPSFYSHPQTIAQLCDTVVDRVLDLLALPVTTFRWQS